MRTSRPHRKFLLPAAVTLAAVALIAGLALGRAGSPRTSSPATAAAPADDGHAGHDHGGDPAHTKPAFTRDLAVYTGRREPAPSAHAVHMRALLVAGALPKGAVTATVLTDEDCAPDSDGVSHCRNKLRLASGRTITVRHPHRMMDVPCMTPGEKVRVARGAMPGMSAEEHAQMSADAGAGHDHGAMPGMDMSGHAEAPANTERPVALTLGGFAVVNALVLAYAAVVRRRPDTLRRRQTLARVRSTPPRQSVFRSSSTPSSRS
jgi:hypothetical protein